MSTLYDIKEEFLKLYDLAIEDGDEQAFADTLEALKGDLSNKAAGYAKVMRQLEMEEGECDAVIAEFKHKKEVRTNARKRMAEAIMEAMDIAGEDKLPAGEFEFKIQNNGGVLPLIIDGEVPDNFMKVIYEPDNKKIREALADGELGFARLGERGRHLKIK